MPEFVTHARQTDAEGLARLDALLAPARELALALVPQVEHSLEAGASPTPKSSRPGPKCDNYRTLDSEANGRAFDALDAVLGPVHDIAVTAFQRMVDRLTGFACPTLEQNAGLVEQLMLRVDRFGFGLYYPTDDGLVRVRMHAVPVSPSAARSASPASVSAGRINLRLAKQPGEPVGPLAGVWQRALTSVPQLIVARSAAEAEQIWAERRAATPPKSSDPADDADAHP